MRKFKKALFFEIVAICINISLLLNSDAYATSSLRVNSMFDGTRKDENGRVAETVEFYDKHANEYAEIWANEDANLPPFYEKLFNLVEQGPGVALF
ncbi:MAG: hypothetical protein KJ706_03590 [Candidatus Omnitrophica bacterium]|nr:hypothetical protein [Candidatus Omnitrophota bacterium]MBU4589647.1 hypothetical protein [Candidatus Omnitrophota bacterium]